MHFTWTGSAPESNQRASEGLLRGPLRRDLCDLNGWFLELALVSQETVDPRFALPPGLRERLSALDREGIRRAADCPFSLFEFQLPVLVGSLADSVADAATSAERPVAARPVCEPAFPFALEALALLGRLLFSAPHAARLVFGLPEGIAAALTDLPPSRRASLAASPQLLRPRWAGHSRFWPALIEAVSSDSVLDLQIVHWMGFCLPETPPAGNPTHPQGDRGPRRGSRA